MARKKKSSGTQASPSAPRQQTLQEFIAAHPHASALGIYTFFTLIFFYDVIFGGKLFISGDQQLPAAIGHVLKNVFATEGIFPQWTPHIFAGMPSFAGLLYMPYTYLPYLPLTLIDSIISLPALLWHVIHYPFAGFGVYLLLRDQEVDFIPALLGGFAFMFTPYLIVMETAGHGSQMMATALMPMVFWAVNRLFDRGGWLYFGLAGLLVGIQFQRAHIQIIYYTWMLLGTWVIWLVVSRIRSKQSKEIPALLGKVAFLLIVGLSMSAMQILPIYEYGDYSIRGVPSVFAADAGEKGVGFDYATQWSFPPQEILTFIVPSFYGYGRGFRGFPNYWGEMPFTEHTNYMGILIFVLAIVAVARVRKPLISFLGVVIVLALLVAFGKYTPFYRLLYDYLPFFNKFRVPVMILVLVQLSFAVLAGFGLHWIMEKIRELAGKQEALAPAKKLMLTAAGILGLALLLTALKDSFFNFMQGVYPVDSRLPAEFAFQVNRARFDMFFTDFWLVSLWLAAGLALTALALKRSLGLTTFASLIFIITLVDLWSVDYDFNKPHPAELHEEFLKPDGVTEFLKKDPGLYRIFPVDRLFSEVRWAAQDIQSIGGYHPAKPRVYQNILDASRIDREYLYKYTDPNTPAARRKADQQLLNFLNVKYVITPHSIPEPALAGRAQGRLAVGGEVIDIIVYENTEALPRAFLVGQYEVIEDARAAVERFVSAEFDPSQSVILQKAPKLHPVPDSTARAEVVKYGIQEIRIKTSAQQPQLLVLSDTHYPPAWHVRVNGEEQEVLQANHAFRAVELPAGEHEIVFYYHSTAFSVGVWLTIISTIAVFGLVFFGYRRERQSRRI